MPLLSSLGAVAGGVTLTYEMLQKNYGDFAYPQAEVELGGKPFADKGKRMVIDDIHIELTSGFEASVARFRIYDVFDTDSGQFRFADIKKQVVLGNSLQISLGYLDNMKPVFVGFVASVSFGYDPVSLAYAEVTGMDIKGVMMSNCYAQQLTAKSYGDAVREVLMKTTYEKLQSGGAVTSVLVIDTPDKAAAAAIPPGTASSLTLEMTSESDYDFVVKAAKKYNYEFYTDKGVVNFRPAKSNPMPMATLGAGTGLLRFEIGYSLSGMVETVEARAMDAGNGQLIKASSKYQGSLSTSSKAKGLVSKSKKVYIDPSISSQEHATARASSLMEEVSYRLGSLDCECPGIPDLSPGRFLTVQGLGSPVDNSFYITTVTHEFQADSGYKTLLRGKASAVQASM